MDLAIIESITLLSIVKLLLAILLFVYLVFAGLMARQISAMTKAVAMKDDYIIRVLGLLHFLFAVIVFIMILFV